MLPRTAPATDENEDCGITAPSTKSGEPVLAGVLLTPTGPLDELGQRSVAYDGRLLN